MGFSRSLFLRRSLYVAGAVISVSSAWSASADLTDRGAYLARITGCVGCHTPRTRDGDVVTSQLMSGGDHPIPSNLGAFVPPNITPDKETGLGDWRPKRLRGRSGQA